MEKREPQYKNVTQKLAQKKGVRRFTHRDLIRLILRAMHLAVDNYFAAQWKRSYVKNVGKFASKKKFGR